MDRKELKDFFDAHYSIKFVPQAGNNVVIDDRKRKAMEIAMRGMDDWFDNYFELMFNKRAKMNVQQDTKSLSTPFAKPVMRLDKTKATIIIVNSYFDYLVSAQCPQYADGRTRKRVRRAVYNDFVKGRYFSNKVGNKLYSMIEKISKE